MREGHPQPQYRAEIIKRIRKATTRRKQETTRTWMPSLCTTVCKHRKLRGIGRGAMLQATPLPSPDCFILRSIPRNWSQVFDVPTGTLGSPMSPWHVPNPPEISTEGYLTRDVVRACATTSVQGLKKWLEVASISGLTYKNLTTRRNIGHPDRGR